MLCGATSRPWPEPTCSRTKAPANLASPTSAVRHMDKFLASVGFGVVTASILAIAAVGFTLQFGVTNILNLAYGDIMTAAAFVAYLVTSTGLSVCLALVAGA